jgi:uridine kinase
VRVNGPRAELTLAELARVARAATPPPSMPVSVIAIDGHGGAGKSTLARHLSVALDDAPIVHTDEFASWEEPLDWWPRLVKQVLVPLASDGVARYQRYDWDKRELDNWIDVSGRLVILEGVTANRLAFRPYLSFAIWVETPRAVCLARGIERDGEAMRAQWDAWMAAEDEYVERESPREHADLVVAGAPAADAIQVRLS